MSNEPPRWVVLSIFAVVAIAMAFTGAWLLNLNLWIGLGLAALATIANAFVKE